MATYKQHSACTTPAALHLKDSGIFQSPLSQLHHRQEGRSTFLWAMGWWVAVLPALVLCQS